MAWITAAQALEVLQVRPQTLYANVSRGRIRAKPDTADPRRSLYRREDVLRMAGRSRGRRKVETVAAQAIEWGDPVLPSAISTVMDGRLWYRGRDAVDLAAAASFEDVAGLLWEVDASAVGAALAHAPGAGHAARAGSALAGGLAAMAARCAGDLPSLGRAPQVLRAEAGGVLATLVHAMLRLPAARAERTTSERIAQAWGCPAGEDTLRRALVLLADHELNASTFATRVTISTGAALSAGVLAGLTTLTGPLHGGAAASLHALVESARRSGAEAAVRDWLAQGRVLPGFGHPLYPDGDVRADALLARRPLRRPFVQLAEFVQATIGEQPNIDFALVASCDALELPPDAPFVLFALARCAGWLAHALEQAQANRLIRPRARYVGVMPPAPLSRSRMKPPPRHG